MIEAVNKLSENSLAISEGDLLSQVQSYDRFKKYLLKLPLAIEFAKKAHAGQKRASGEDFFTHPLAVASILASLSMDSLTIIVALLHDVVEDTKISLEEVRELFGSKVASLVDGVTKLTKIEGKSESISQAENFKKLIIAISKDIRVLIIKLADRLHNMQTLPYLASVEKRGRIALETMEIYAPLAERVGMHQIKTQLQDLSFATLYPASRDSILKRLSLLKKGDSIELVQKIANTLNEIIKLHGVDAVIVGREKTPFSIWEKMKRKNISFEQLSDVMAFRVIVPDVLSCYKALGIIHSNYHIVPSKFKDFISLPKQNGYKSIHTVIIGPERHRIEVQIRTAEMQDIAENGIAAHWTYKQKYKDIDKIGSNWIKSLVHLSNTTNDISELVKNTQLEIYANQIFCFTPKGSVIALPRGASAIDFAYAVHSDLGNSCVGVKINHRLAPLKAKLENGDQVEILTSADNKPLPYWEQIAITSKALNEIRKSIKASKYKEIFELGKALLTQTFVKCNKEFSLRRLESVLLFFNKKTIEQLVCAVGEGVICSQDVFVQVYPDLKLKKIRSKRTFLLQAFSFFKLRKKKKLAGDNSIPIKGVTPGITIHLAPCCSPIPGDRIVGIRDINRGVVVHTLNCATLQNYVEDPVLWIDLSWDKNVTGRIFTGSINLVLQNVVGAAAEVVLEIAKNDCNISNFRILERGHDFFEITIDVEMKGLKQLTNIISVIKSKSCVYSACRVIK
ncbi:MAG: bifunctional (p)ppGpp synthetase/guanosine-3',5'-bis(diphosphate) 3'-pyrophosphohydrolase [Rickettsiales bacterium]|nr:bifunctional (p)ppGpp synthetase/guanosine-3',5'-bis(diphosphate) 3'-pyrophosphohydrolase [Rickettsiales bacterium]